MISPAELVDAVVRDNSVRHEVVCVFDVKIEHGSIEGDPFDVRHDIELAVLVDHHHPGSDRRSRHEGQCVRRCGLTAVGGKSSDGSHRDVHHRLHEFDGRSNLGHVGARRLEPPARGPASRGADGEAESLESFAPRLVAPEESDSVERAGAPSVTAQHDRQCAFSELGVRRVRGIGPNEPGEVHVFVGGHDLAAGAGRDAHALVSASLMDPIDTGSTHVAAAVVRQNVIACSNILDDPQRSIGHHDLAARHQTLVRVADHHDVAVLAREQPDDLPLRAVRVLELIDQHVSEPVPPPLERIRVLAKQPNHQQQQVVEVHG